MSSRQESAQRPAAPAGQSHPPVAPELAEAAAEPTGNEDPGSELTEQSRKRTPEGPSSPPKRERTLGNHPVDPNGLPARTGLPPGIDRDTATDPGKQTPGAPEVDNRS
ncbi:hypothetical protein PIGHUM_02037 [Pigmentiphaga humi]|uniref:Uncharacterized protein n=1 Tax=Pigmentiphaga humi TaxID=2478468 RepID=A0A3P4B253_9BURK|nr:hypothetical protein [Pigmentiphaga humi]VCU69971.1 hypothetical protein PIGHUM_02037 [Pigmentiphaga humi]